MAVGRVELTPGEVWWARPDAVVGREQAGRRPVLVVAGALYLQAVTTLALVVPLTTTDRGWSNRVSVSGVVGLPAPSFAMSEQVRVISRERLTGRLGRVTPQCLAEVRSWVLDNFTD